MILTAPLLFFISLVTSIMVAKAAVDIKADAKAIADSNLDPCIIASILLYRTPDERQKINEEVANLRKGERICDKNFMKNLVTTRKYTNTHFYSPAKGVLVEKSRSLFCTKLMDEYEILSYYLSRYLYIMDETTITIILVLTKDMDRLKQVYKGIDKDFGGDIDDQRHPYQNLLKVWTEKSREPDPPGPLNNNDVTKDAKALFDVQQKWNDDRDLLETILIRKPLKYSAAVLTEFEKLNKNSGTGLVTIEDSIRKYIKNGDLQDAYMSLAAWVKDKYTYISNLVTNLAHNNQTYYTSWILLAATTAPEEWPKVNEAHRKLNQNKLLKTYILQRDEPHIFVESMVVMVDPTYKPTFLVQPPSAPPAAPSAG